MLIETVGSRKGNSESSGTSVSMQLPECMAYPTPFLWASFKRVMWYWTGKYWLTLPWTIPPPLRPSSKKSWSKCARLDNAVTLCVQPNQCCRPLRSCYSLHPSLYSAYQLFSKLSFKLSRKFLRLLSVCNSAASLLSLPLYCIASLAPCRV